MASVRLDYVPRARSLTVALSARQGHVNLGMRTCERTACGKPFMLTTQNRRRRFCSRHCAGYRDTSGRKGRIRKCLGYLGHACDERVRKKPRCTACQRKHQAKAEARLEKRAPEPGPRMCARPVRGGHCLEILLFQVTRDGLTVEWCPRHGERTIPRIWPGSPNYPITRR